MLRYTTDRARPGLLDLYGIRQGNRAGQFLQPRSPHWKGRYIQLLVKTNLTQFCDTSLPQMYCFVFFQSHSRSHWVTHRWEHWAV